MCWKSALMLECKSVILESRFSGARVCVCA